MSPRSKSFSSKFFAGVVCVAALTLLSALAFQPKQGDVPVQQASATPVR